MDEISISASHVGTWDTPKKNWPLYLSWGGRRLLFPTMEKSHCTINYFVHVPNIGFPHDFADQQSPKFSTHSK